MGKINCRKSQLNLIFTLSGGQSFRWKETCDKKWIGILSHQVWFLHQDEDFLFYEVIPSSDLLENRNGKNFPAVMDAKKSNGPPNNVTEIETSATNLDLLLKKYFRLEDLNLEEAYTTWSSNDDHFKDVSSNFKGVRILNQDPVENLFSFICSSNNNITRISSMVQKMCALFGNKIATLNGEVYYDFPTIAALADANVERELRTAGFGYRARFISESASKLLELGGEDWLENLKKLPYDSARKELMLLPGIGGKVADCICLMSLGFLESVPVDTHIFQVAAEWYLPHLRKSKSVTPKIHQEIGDFFRKLYGSHAGWAHTILFCGNLKKFEESNTSVQRKRKRKEK